MQSWTALTVADQESSGLGHGTFKDLNELLFTCKVVGDFYQHSQSSHQLETDKLERNSIPGQSFPQTTRVAPGG